MSEHDDDAVVRRYRELRREVPSAALDVKVLATARSAVAPRSFTRRWAAPLAAAAVVVLAVGVTLQMQHPERKPPSASESVPALHSAQAPFVAARPAGAPEPIPFAPRRAVEPASAPAQSATAVLVPVPAAPAAKQADIAGAEARMKKETENAARAAAAPVAGAAAPQRGPFTIDRVTTSGVQVKTLPQR
jgi:hypothetical protein